jgi:hypothetical protein
MPIPSGYREKEESVDSPSSHRDSSYSILAASNDEGTSVDFAPVPAMLKLII